MTARNHHLLPQIFAAPLYHHHAGSVPVQIGGTSALCQADPKKQGKEKKPDDIW